MPRNCTVQNCDREIGRHGARGMCPLHYRRSRNGIPLEGKPVHEYCLIDGCGKKPRSKHAELCAMHYHRKYRGGTAGESAPRKRAHKNTHCSIGGCDNPDDGAGLCNKHYARKLRHGDVHKVIAAHERAMPTGEDNPNWAGEFVGYGGAHSRVKSRHGSAEHRRCVDCGTQARHWSYNHNAPDEREELINSTFVAYSPSVEYYSPRCVPCHKRFDLGRINATTCILS